jgi:hypothetical protein
VEEIYTHIPLSEFNYSRIISHNGQLGSIRIMDEVLVTTQVQASLAKQNLPLAKLCQSSRHLCQEVPAAASTASDAVHISAQPDTVHDDVGVSDQEHELRPVHFSH